MPWDYTFIKLVFITIFFSYFLNKLHHALMGYKQRWRRQMGVLELRKTKKSRLNTSKIHNEVLKAPSFGQTWIKKCKSARFMKIEGFFFKNDKNEPLLNIVPDFLSLHSHASVFSQIRHSLSMYEKVSIENRITWW